MALERLEGATVDLTSTGYLIIHWAGFADQKKLTIAEWDVYKAMQALLKETADEEKRRLEATQNGRKAALKAKGAVKTFPPAAAGSFSSIRSDGEV